MRIRSLWYTFALASVVSWMAGVATAQNPEGSAPEAKVPEAKAPEASSKRSAAQEPAAQKPGAQDPASAPSDAGPPLYGRVTAKEAAVRCFASQRSPVYEDILREGDVVMVGEATGEFRKVIMPLGVVGYVHRDFATTPVAPVNPAAFVTSIVNVTLVPTSGVALSTILVIERSITAPGVGVTVSKSSPTPSPGVESASVSVAAVTSASLV